MKKLLLVSAILSTAFLAVMGDKASVAEQDSTTIFCTPDLYTLANHWSHEYNASNPEGLIRIVTKDSNSNSDDIDEKDIVQLAPGTSGIISGSAWKLIVGRDVIVPVINSGNPCIEEIRCKGVSPARLSLFFGEPGNHTWGTLLGNTDRSVAVVYCIDDDVMRKSLSEFLGTDVVNIMPAKNTAELISAVTNELTSIGFCRLADLYDPSMQSLMESISLLPVDRNNDGKLDHNEDIYRDLNAFARGVWIGKYPPALVRGIYIVSAKQPDDDATIAFLKWLIGTGQNYLKDEGYTALLSGERLSGTEKLAREENPGLNTPETASIFKTLLLVIIVLTAVTLLVIVLSKIFQKRPVIRTIPQSAGKVLDGKSISLPGGILFDKTHTWAFMEQDGYVKVGVDDFMHHVTGRISKVKLKREGESVKKGEEIFSIVRNGRQLNLYAPVSGIIRKRNSVLESDAAIVNDSPYTEGWVYMIEPVNWSRESPLLMMADRHRQFIEQEITRLRDFIAEVFSAGNPGMATIVLQDGGGLIDSPLEDMSPEVWEEFQTKFIDPSRQVWFYELY